jgi:hypothetical protein
LLCSVRGRAVSCASSSKQIFIRQKPTPGMCAFAAAIPCLRCQCALSLRAVAAVPCLLCCVVGLFCALPLCAGAVNCPWCALSLCWCCELVTAVTDTGRRAVRYHRASLQHWRCELSLCADAVSCHCALTFVSWRSQHGDGVRRIHLRRNFDIILHLPGRWPSRASLCTTFKSMYQNQSCPT